MNSHRPTLRALWAPALTLHKVLDPDLILVVLRDPVERFHSAMRQASLQRNALAGTACSLGFMASAAIEAQWGGLYATQLEEWERHFPTRNASWWCSTSAWWQDTQGTADRVWQRLGLELQWRCSLLPERPELRCPDNAWRTPRSGTGPESDQDVRARATAAGSMRGIEPDLWPELAAHL